MVTRRNDKQGAMEQADRKRSQSKSNSTPEVKSYDIHRLLEYPQVRNIGASAKMQLLGELAPGANIEDEIDQRYGEGWYRIGERLASGKLGHSWIVRGRDIIESEAPEDNIEPAIGRERVVVHHQPDVSTLRDVAKVAALEAVQGIREEMAKMQAAPVQTNALRDVLKQVQEAKQVVAELVPETKEKAEQPQPDRSLEDRITEAVILKVLDKGDESTLDKVLHLIGGRKEPSIWETVGEYIVKPLAPMVAPIVAPLIGGLIARTMTPQPPVAPPSLPVAAPVPPAPDPQPAAPVSPAIDPIQKAWLRVVRNLIEDCEENANIYGSAESVVDLADRFPQFAMIVRQLVSLPPAQVLDMLLSQMPQTEKLRTMLHAQEWIEQLQKQILGIYEEADVSETANEKSITPNK